jgi:hypothetical protein
MRSNATSAGGQRGREVGLLGYSWRISTWRERGATSACAPRVSDVAQRRAPDAMLLEDQDVDLMAPGASWLRRESERGDEARKDQDGKVGGRAY